MNIPDSKNVLLIKLAAIGDVVTLCRVLIESTGSISKQVVFHWIIDSQIEPLAKKLLSDTGLQIKFYPISSLNLFKGSIFKKIVFTLKLSRLIKKIAPITTAIFHRDNRYRLLCHMTGIQDVFICKKQRIPELEEYKNVLSACLSEVEAWTPNAYLMKEPIKHIQNKEIKTIGILIGGGQSQKITYKEKQWPYFYELIQKLLIKTEAKIYLFGSHEDQHLAQDILINLTQKIRIENYVGALALEDTPLVLQKLDIFIGVDSGLSHIATLAMTHSHQKIILLFGPTNYKIWAPIQYKQNTVTVLSVHAPCSPCYKDDGNYLPCLYKNTSKYKYCMYNLNPESVLSAMDLF